ncbi:OLC1v1018675C1 [Oldenlandia corymbosa var. corymbosa]|uniref:OLC1v1018675C1 n=1 Tax=Oldenlandia corymbosa var. corymbosa TaxID=529605 RepID=A0AAV1EC87_OLDCO|nr:OLC1v1018675C1 [Oldenlandia corymbosa var. corymbosa]
MSSGVAGCTQVASKSVEGRMEAQVQLMKSQIDFLHDALAEVKEANRDLSQLLSNQQDKAMLVSNIYSHHWCRNLDDWHDLRNALRERYAGTNTFDEAKVKLLNCKQNGRSIQSYFEELEGLFLSSEVDDNDYMLTDRFHYGLDKWFKQHQKIRRQSRLYEAYYAALEVEREHDTSCGWNGPIEDQGLMFGAEDGDQRTCIFRTKCSVGPIKEERMDLDYLCDRELVQESYDQGDENVINFGIQTKGDDDLMEISAEEYQESLTLWFRWFHDVVQAFSYKLWWKFKHQNSLWSKFISSLSDAARKKTTWSRVLEVEHEAAKNAKGLLDLRMVQGLHNMEVIMNDERDLFSWQHSASCNFSIKSAYLHLRRENQKDSLARNFWHQSIPLRVSFFVWKLRNLLVSFPEILSNFGIQVRYVVERDFIERTFGLQLQKIQKRTCISVCWKPSREKGFVLNSDGLAINDDSGHGIAIRHHDGYFMYGEHGFLGAGDSFGSEVYGLLFGVRKCDQLDLAIVDIQTDNKVLDDLLGSLTSIPWKYYFQIKEIHEIMSRRSYRISHILANAVADSLAGQGSLGHSCIMLDWGFCLGILVV